MTDLVGPAEFLDVEMDYLDGLVALVAAHQRGRLQGTDPVEAKHDNGLRRLPALNLPHNPLSTMRRQTGILVRAHPVLRDKHEASATSASLGQTGWTTS